MVIDRQRVMRGQEADEDGPHTGVVNVNQAGIEGYSLPAARSTPRAGGWCWHTPGVLTLFGAWAVTFMMLMYALERRGRGFTLAFACGCALSSLYGFLVDTWPFGVVEAIWAVIALKRYRSKPTMDAQSTET
jgi:hypothetical protein